MGTQAFTNFLISIQGHIGTLNNTVGILEKQITASTTRSEGGALTLSRRHVSWWRLKAN
jgi:hypothetical protein